MRMRSIALLCGAGLLLIGFGCSTTRLQSGVGEDPDFKRYANCHFADGLQTVQVDPLAPGVSVRTVETAGGPKTVNMLSGARIMFAYPETDFFANVKAEKLPASQYPHLKQTLMENFDYVLNSAPSNKINNGLVLSLNGLEAHGLDRDRLEGGVIGIYLLFADKEHTAVTIYFLNQEPSERKFKTLDEYRKLRDQFLLSFASCVSNRS